MKRLDWFDWLGLGVLAIFALVIVIYIFNGTLAVHRP